MSTSLLLHTHVSIDVRLVHGLERLLIGQVMSILDLWK